MRALTVSRPRNWTALTGLVTCLESPKKAELTSCKISADMPESFDMISPTLLSEPSAEFIRPRPQNRVPAGWEEIPLGDYLYKGSSSIRSRIAHTRATVVLMVSASQGLERNWCTGPMDFMTMSLSECPERTMRTTCGCNSFTRLSSWQPSMPGMRISVTITLNRLASRIFSASCPLVANSISHSFAPLPTAGKRHHFVCCVHWQNAMAGQASHLLSSPSAVLAVVRCHRIGGYSGGDHCCSVVLSARLATF